MQLRIHASRHASQKSTETGQALCATGVGVVSLNIALLELTGGRCAESGGLGVCAVRSGRGGTWDLPWESKDEDEEEAQKS